MAVGESHLLELVRGVGVIIPKFDRVFETEYGLVEATVISLLCRLACKHDRALGQFLAGLDRSSLLLDRMDRFLQMFNFSVPVLGFASQGFQRHGDHGVFAIGRLNAVVHGCFPKDRIGHLLGGVFRQSRMVSGDDLEQDTAE